MRDALRAIAASLRDTNGDDGEPFVADAAHRSVPFSESNFHELEPSDGVLCFVDGGNAEIVSDPGYALSLIRVYANLYDGAARMKWHERIEFYCVVRPVRVDGTLYYRSEHIFLNNEQLIGPLRFHVFDKTIRQGPFMADIAAIGGIVRRFAEWQMALRAVASLPADAVIVRDGTLRAGMTGEQEFADALFRAAAKRSIGVGAVAKRSSLLTTTGKQVASVLMKKAPFSRWYYHPLFEGQEPAVAKLHELASHALRVEVREADMPRFMAALAANSSDARIPGYPFGLVDADQFARVTGVEQKLYASLFAGLQDVHGRLNSLVE